MLTLRERDASLCGHGKVYPDITCLHMQINREAPLMPRNARSAIIGTNGIKTGVALLYLRP